MPSLDAEEQQGGGLVIRLFGQIEILCGDVAVHPRMSQRARWLLAMLVLSHGQAKARATLAATLWPNYDSASSDDVSKRDDNFRQQLRSLRKWLGTEASRLHEEAGSFQGALRFDTTDAVVDTELFKQRLRYAQQFQEAAAFRSAIHLYRGELLEGCNEQWVVEPRKHYRRLYLSALNGLANSAFEDSDFDQAQLLLRQALELKPTDEATARQLMVVLHAAGKFAQAEAVYQNLERVSRKVHPGTPLESSTTSLLRQLRAARVPPQQNVPAAPTRAQRRVRLPVPISSLVGRQASCNQIAARLFNSRLVTLIGPGGIGKTRLAIEVAHQIQHRYRDGVTFVDLSALPQSASQQHVLQSVAEALLLSERLDKQNEDHLHEALASYEVLLVLDNCEHVVTAAAPVVKRLLQKAAGVRVLATSRESLRISGERAHRVPPLSLPPAGDLPSSEEVKEFLHSEAVQLFSERVAQPHFDPTGSNRTSVGWICRALDGHPLAIELAAAALDTGQTVDDLATSLRTSFWGLTGGDRTAPERYQNLQATIEWSYQLLTPQEQATLRCAAVFTGSLPLAALQQVTQDSSTEQHVARLLQKGLLYLVSPIEAPTDQKPSAPRFRLAESVRQFALEKLDATGDAPAVRWQHAGYYLNLVERAEPGLSGPEQKAWLNTLELDRGNLTGALVWANRAARVNQETEVALRFAGVLWRFWMMRGGLISGIPLIQQALALPGEVSYSVRLKALNGAGNGAYFQGDWARACSCFEECLRVAQAQSDLRAEATARGGLGNVAQGSGDLATARHWLESCVPLFEQLGDTQRAAFTLGNLANLATDLAITPQHATGIRRPYSSSARSGTGIIWSLASTI